MKKMKPVIIGIIGGSAAGKTTLARQLADSLADFSPVILIKITTLETSQNTNRMKESGSLHLITHQRFCGHL